VNVDEVRDLFTYDEWANDRLFRAVEALSDEQFTRRVASSFSSLRDTLSHILAEEWVWLRRCLGENPTRPADWTAMSSRAELLSALERIQRDRSGFLMGLPPTGCRVSSPSGASKGTSTHTAFETCCGMSSTTRPITVVKHPRSCV
jgi:DinB family